MRHQLTTNLTICLTALAFGCGAEDQDSGGESLITSVERALASVRYENVIMKNLQSGAAVQPSIGLLRRTRRKVSFRAWTTQLPAPESVSVIWAIFNHPEYCTEGNPLTGSPCGPADLAIDAVGGHISAFGWSTERWEATRLAGTLAVGKTDKCIEGLPCRDGLTNPFGAEVHVVVLDAETSESLQGAQFIP